MDSTYLPPKLSFTLLNKSSNSTSSSSSLARSGELLFTPNSNSTSTSSNTTRTIQTPAIIAYSKRGAIPHLTRDNVAKLPIELISLSLEHLLDSDPPSYSQAPFGLHKFIGLQESKIQSKHPLLVLGLRDPTGVPERKEGDGFVSCDTMRGNLKVTPSTYVAWTTPRPPDILLALNDSSLDSIGKKRTIKISIRSLNYLTEILRETKGLQNVFAPLVGNTLDHREEYSKALIAKSELPWLNFTSPSISNEFKTLDSQISGYVLTVPPPSSPTPTSTIPELFNSSLSILPTTKPRMVISASGPHDILRLVQSVGIDLFLDSWSSGLSTFGVALDFDFPVPPSSLISTSTSNNNPQVKKKEIGKNLFSSEFSENFAPLSTSNLSLPLSSPHPFGPIPPTLAYTHHLLWQHELTSHIILAIHNSIIMSNFFLSIRNLINSSNGNGKFEEEVERFMNTYNESEGGSFSGGNYKCLREAKEDFNEVHLNRGKGSGKTEKEIL